MANQDKRLDIIDVSRHVGKKKDEVVGLNIPDFVDATKKNTFTGRTNVKKTAKRPIIRNKKKPFRWDLVVLLILVIFCSGCALIIFRDKHKNDFDASKAVAPVYDGQLESEYVSNENQSNALGYKGDNNIICLDAGHGGNDAGAEYKKAYEKDQCLEMVRLVKAELESEGYKVVLTRDSDTNPSLNERVKSAEDANAGIMVSIHRNFYQGDSKSGGNQAKGVECWIGTSRPKDANQLANVILSEISKLQLTSNRGVKTGTINNANRNYRINTSKCTSCILELGFITNTGDDVLVTSKKNECARAIAQGIIGYIKSS